MDKIVLGLLAHVDAGKTTLTESLLYLSGTIEKQGRVDHQSSFLDYDKQERDRGITIYSKVSSFKLKHHLVHLLDTPGHIDFSGEMERALSALDAAVLIVSGLDGVQSHTKTIWKLLRDYHLPTFVFVNKMDLSPLSKDILLKDLHDLDNSILPLDDQEDVATCSDDLLEEYMNDGHFQDQTLKKAIHDRQLFPVIFGSALKNEGVKDLMHLIDTYVDPKRDEQLSGIVYKIGHDDHERLTFVRLSGGSLKPKDDFLGEKINQIRNYQGEKYTLLDQAEAGDIVALTGLKETYAGETFGDYISPSYELEPFMHYALHLEDNDQKTQMLANLKQLSEEEPLLHLKIKDGDHIQVSLMGEVQIEILKELIKERFHQNVTIDSQSIAYKEAITKTSEGVGHFEPLRHYAEVHVLLEPLPKGSGLVFENHCQTNLPPHFQRLIMTHLEEKEHKGVLIGAPITDMKITLLGGKHSEVHTVGGDFREAAYRAVRQGLMMNESKLLEPYEHYEIKIPSSMIGKRFYDFENYETPVISKDDGKVATVIGSAPVSFLYDYQKELLSYSKGEGVISYSDPFYDQVIDEEKVLENTYYDPEEDVDDPVGSIFCAHGAGYYVPYDEVYDHMHLDLFTKEKEVTHFTSNKIHISDEEAKRVFESIYGKQERKLAKDFYGKPKKEKHQEAMQVSQKPVCLLVDGYNVIFASDELNQKAKDNLGAARDTLIDMCTSYQGYKGYTLILVFDAYKVEGSLGSTKQYHNIYIVYTKEAQTADAYIESATKHLARDYRVIVATSDNLEQKIVIGHDALRISSRELLSDMTLVSQNEMDDYQRKNCK